MDVTRAVRSTIVGNLFTLAGLRNVEDFTKDLKQHRVKKDQDLAKYVTRIKFTMIPFSAEISTDLFCLTSGKKVSDSVKDDILNFIKKGEEWSAEFRRQAFKFQHVMRNQSNVEQF